MTERLETQDKVTIAAVAIAILLSGIYMNYAGGLTAFFRLSDIDDLRGPSIGFGYHAQYSLNPPQHCTYLAREANKVNFQQNREYIAYKASVYFYDPFIDDQYDDLERYDAFLETLRHAVNLERVGGNLIAQQVYAWCSEGRRIAIQEINR